MRMTIFISVFRMPAATPHFRGAVRSASISSSEGLYRTVSGSRPIFLAKLSRGKIAMRPTEQQDAALLRLWTAAEAYAKATGQGLAGVDQWLPVSAAIDEVAAPEAGGAIRGTTRWSLLPVDYVDSIAIERADTALHESPLPEMTNLFVLSVAGCW